MDAQVQELVVALKNMFNPEPNARKASEETLKKFRTVHGFAVCLFRLMTANELPLDVRQGASIVLKNFIHQSWIPPRAERQDIIADDERGFIKGHLIEALIEVPQLVKNQLELIMRIITERDFPENWPELIPKIMQFLVSQNQHCIFGALMALHLAAKKYEFKTKDNNREPLHKVVETVFPVLIQLFEALMKLPDLRVEVGEMLKLICKIFWTSSQFSICPFFCDNNNLLPWMTLLLALLERPLPEEAQPRDPLLRRDWVWWRCKKWVAHIFTRFFSRFGAPRKEDTPENRHFSQMFRDLYSGKLMKTFLALLDSWRRGTWLPDRVITMALRYIGIGIKYSHTYRMLKSNLEVFLMEICFPLLCFNDEDAVLWIENPHEYLRKEFDVMEDFYNPRITAINVVIDLVSVRGRDILYKFAQAMHTLLTRYAELPLEARNARQKDGALYAIGCLCAKLKKYTSPGHLESMLVTHVLPEFDSPHAFLRARACWLWGQYYDVEFANPQHFLAGLQRVLNALTDRELPVRVRAALALRFLIKSDLATDTLRPVLPRLLEEFFKLMNDLDNDDLVGSLEAVVYKYGPEIAPYAVALCDHLSRNFLRMAASDEEDSSALAAMECLLAIQVILDAVQTLPELYPTLEVVLKPLVQRLLEEDAFEYFQETLKILSFLTYFNRTISPLLWEYFPKLYRAFTEWATDYMDDLLVPLDNYIARGTEAFLANPQYMEMVYSMYQRLVGDPQISQHDAGAACKLVEVVLHNCKGRVDHYIQPVIELAVFRIKHEYTRLPLKVLLVEVVANALYYNPALTIGILDQRGWIGDVFGTWFKLIPDHLMRTHDKKVSILGLSSLLLVPYTALPVLIQGNYRQLVQAVIKLEWQLAVQLEAERIEAESEAKEAGKQQPTGNGELDVDIDDIDDDDEALENDQSDLELPSDQDVEEYEDDELTLLAGNAAEVGGDRYTTVAEGDIDEDYDEDGVLEDEGVEVHSVIDEIDEVIFFVACMKHLAESDPTVFQTVLGGLHEEEKKVWAQLVESVPERERQRAAKAAAATAAGPAHRV